MGRVEDAYTAFQLGAREVGTRVAVGEDSDGPGLIDNERLKTSLEDTFGPLVPIFFISVIASEGLHAYINMVCRNSAHDHVTIPL